MAQRIIGIAGKKKSGKGTLCTMLQAVHPYQETAFAGALWNCMLAMDPWVECDGFLPKYRRLSELASKYSYELCKAEFPDVREYMKRLGTDGVRRYVGNTTWLDVVVREIKSNPDTDFIVSDLRFRNEGEAIHALGGVVVKLERDTGFEDDHESENDISRIYEDFVYVNNSGLNDLETFAVNLNSLFRR